MAALSITALFSYFSDEPKSVERGENHFRSDHIESFCYSDGVIRGTVHASMKSKSYKVTVYLNGGTVKSTECECPRGTYKCSHAAAIVIHSIHNLSRTDVECSWKKQKVPDNIKTVQELFPAPKEYHPLTRAITDNDRNFLRQKLQTYGRFTGISWILAPEPQAQRLPIRTVEEIILSEGFVNNDLKMKYLVEQVRISKEQQLAVNEVTKGQRDNPSWQLLRKGRLTASNFGAVLKAKRATPSLIRRVLGEYHLSGVLAINWGISNEDEAIKSFTTATSLPVEQSGLWVDLSGVLGASPDGLIGANAVLEVKCPYTHRNSTIEEAVNTGKFFMTKSESGTYELSRDHNYWHQVQGQMHLTNRKLCYFVVWTTKQCLVTSIKRDESWADYLFILQDFYWVHIAKNIIEGGL